MLSMIKQLISYILSFLPVFSYKHVPDVGKTTEGFNNQFNSEKDQARRSAYQKTTETFYNLITDFYEWGWGRSFHFAPRYEGETFAYSIKRYEHYVASLLRIPGDKATLENQQHKILDVGCGVGGPMRSIAQFFKYRAHMTGINITAEHIRRCDKYNKAINMNNYDLIKGDFNAIPRDDNSFDAAYDFEATLHSTDLLRTFKEVYRVLKPGARFVSAQYCCTPKYDPKNPTHRDILTRIDNTNGCYVIDRTIPSTKQTFEDAGFKVISHEDVFQPENLNTHPFHEMGFATTKLGLMLTLTFTHVGEFCGFLPKGTCEVQKLLIGGATSFREGGELDIVTPGALFVVEKPLKA